MQVHPLLVQQPAVRRTKPAPAPRAVAALGVDRIATHLVPKMKERKPHQGESTKLLPANTAVLKDFLHVGDIVRVTALRVLPLERNPEHAKLTQTPFQAAGLAGVLQISVDRNSPNWKNLEGMLCCHRLGLR